ncbi:MAG: hypothetical protein MJY74_07780 [Bacteroidaceae bacterium]|nr:hypothetical protein [Bacteroidaceae bacterium]
MGFSKTIADARRYIESNGLYLMQRKDIDKFVECAVKSYGSVSYPLNDFFVGRECTEKDLRAMWIFNLKYFCNNALIYADSPECNAWVLWIEPGCKGMSVLRFFLCGGLRMTTALGLGSMKRIMAYENYCKSVRMNATGGKEWYWYNLVVHPRAHGTHLVTKLFLPMLKYVRSQGRPVFLETHLEKNASMYTHYGFSMASRELMPGTDLLHYGMIIE